MKKLLSLVTVVLGFWFVIFLMNYINLQNPMSLVISEDPRNKGVSVFTHYGYLLFPGELVIDLRGISPDTSAADVTRVLFNYAGVLKDKNFETVVLSYKGERKFQLRGDFFHTLGVDYGTQNPVYMMRTFPENVYEIGGYPAFNTWSGGWLGVLEKQMEDFNDFHKRWYMDAATSGG